MDELFEAALLPWPRVGELLAAGALPILPFGALEQHGPHLPLSTDTVMADGLARRLAAAVGGVLLPAVPYGQTTDNRAFPGTVSLSFDTVRGVAVDIAAALQLHGARALIIVNGDFGNRAPLTLAARQISDAGLRVLVVNYPGLEKVLEDMMTTTPAGFGLVHADEFETSVVLALRPDAVDMGRAVAEYPVFPPTFPSEPVDLRAISASGVFGDPRPATAELGERMLVALTAAAVELVTAFVDSVG